MELDKKDNINKKPNKGIVKRILKVFLYIILVIVGLNLFLYILLSIPFVQEKVTDFAVKELKTKLKTEIAIDELRLSLFNHVSLKGVYLEDQSKDTLLYAQSLEASLSPLELIKNGKLAITSITLDDFVINVNQQDSISDFNFQFIIDAFASKDTTQTDTTKSSLLIVIEDIDIKRGRLNYDILSAPQTPGLFNASHISLYNLQANLDINSIDPDRFDIELNKLAVQEKSGLEIKSLKGHFYSNKTKLWIEGLALSLPNSHLITNKAQYDLGNSEFSIGTQDTELDANDLTAILPGLKHLTNKITLNTDITGTLPNITINEFAVTYGEEAIINAKASISDYAHYGDADIDLSIDRFRISPNAITSFARVGDSTFIAPDILKTVGDVYLKGNIGGKLSKFKVNAEAWCRQGAIVLLANGGADSTFSHFSINSKIETQNFNLSKLLGADTGLGKLSAHLSLNAKQTNNKLSATATGLIEGIGYKENTIKNIAVEAFYNPEKMGIKTNAQTAIGSIFIEADMTQAKVPDINFDLDIKDLQTNYFYKDEAWVDPKLTFCLNGHLKGLDVDNIIGKIQIDSLNFRDSLFQLRPGPFVLELNKIADDDKSITLTSSILSATIKGDYKLTTLGDEFSNMLHDYVPNIFQEKKHLKREYNNFVFSMTANNTEQIGDIFGLPVDIIAPATLGGRVSTISRRINVKGDIPHLKFGDINIRNTHLNIVNIDSAFSIKLGSNLFMEKGLYDISLGMNGAGSTVQTFVDIISDSTDINIEGHIESLVEFSRDEKNKLITHFEVIPNTLSVGDLDMTLMPAQIMNIEDRTTIKDLGIMINEKRYLGAEGIISKEESDILSVYFDNAQIGDVLGAFGIKNIFANIDGDIMFKNLLDKPELYTEKFNVSDIIIFGDTIGTMNLESLWSDDLGGLKLNAALKNKDKLEAQINGMVYTSKDSLDLKVDLDRFPLKWAQPFAADMLNKLSGSISTGLTITGSMKAPIVTGFFGFNDTSIGVAYTNVTYSISDTIEVSPQKIGFNNLTLKDSNGNTAKVNATVTHKNFNDIKYSLNMNLNNLMVLNTENRTDSLFYGRVFASGTVRIDGDEKNTNIDMTVKNGKNSNLNIVIPSTSEASDYQSVVFINVPEEKLKNSPQSQTSIRNQDALPIKLKVALSVTQDLKLGVIIDPTTGNSMDVKGNGTINFSYDMVTENMTTFGDYTVSDGNVKLNLQNISKLNFKIKDGSRLTFIGDPMKTTFDINAYRRVKADLKTLDASFESDGTSTRVQVDCDLGIKGNLDKMDVTYDISLPDANDDVQRKVNSLISTQEQKVRQFAYLIVSGSFYSNTGSSGANFTDGMWTSMASGSLSSVLNSAFRNILGDKWEIGTNIESNDGSLSDMDMSVNVSRKFLDDKLRINTNLGYRTDASTTDNSVIGDFDVEYQLNSIWTLKAYSHTNDKFYRQAPTTQGVGIVYTKEARTLKRLFQSFKRRRRNRDTNNNTQSIQQRAESPLPTDSIAPIEKQPATIKEQE